MKIEGYLFLFVAVFLAGSDAVYWFTSHDPTGTTALALATGLGLIVGIYMTFNGQRMDPRPEDLPDADIADGAGEIGFFSPHSWWPLPLALSAAVIALGVVFGWWLVVIGFAMLIPSLSGLLFEYYVNQPEDEPAGEPPTMAPTGH